MDDNPPPVHPSPLPPFKLSSAKGFPKIAASFWQTPFSLPETLIDEKESRESSKPRGHPSRRGSFSTLAILHAPVFWPSRFPYYFHLHSPVATYALTTGEPSRTSLFPALPRRLVSFFSYSPGFPASPYSRWLPFSTLRPAPPRLSSFLPPSGCFSSPFSPVPFPPSFFLP